MTMEADLKAKWVEALRSGKYQQGRLSLCKNGKYCCLGVLAAVSGSALSTPEDSDSAYQAFPLKSADVYLLERMNDSQGRSFAQIADHIERNL